MDTRRWLNQSQPQMLQSATILLYINAVFALIQFRGIPAGLWALVYLLPFAGAGAGYGIANDRKWGYQLALVVAIVPLALTVVAIFGVYGPNLAVDFNNILTVLFQVLLVVLLVHPLSRSYQRIWFK